MAGPTATTPALWLKADAGAYSDAGTTPAGNADAVQQWNDQSGNGVNYSQATSGNRPTYVTGVRNSLPVIRFDGTNDRLGANLTVEPYLVIAVLKADTIGTHQTFFGADTAAGVSPGAYYCKTSDNSGTPIAMFIRVDNSGSQIQATQNAITATTWMIIVMRRVSNTWSVRQKIMGASGTATSAATLSTIQSSTSRVGCGWYNDVEVDFFDGDIGELLVYSTDPGDAEVAQIEYYLFNRWGFGAAAGGATINYLASVFDDPGSGERLMMLESADGSTFYLRPLSYAPTSGHVVRDPSLILRGSRWWLCHTNLTGTGDGTTGFDIAYSDDDCKSFTYSKSVDCTALASLDRTWAPEWFADVDNSLHVLVALSADSGATFDIYELHPNNSSDPSGTWSSPTLVSGLPTSTYIIDPYLRCTAGAYYLWFRHQTAGPVNEIEVYKSSSPFSGYAAHRTGDWQGFGSTEYEGPVSFRLLDGTEILYMDQMPGGSVGIKYSTQTAGDWTGSGSTTWSAPTLITLASGANITSFTPRHGTVVYLPAPPASKPPFWSVPWRRSLRRRIF